MADLTVRIIDSKEGMGEIGVLWADIASKGKLPLMHDTTFSSVNEFVRHRSLAINNCEIFDKFESGEYDITVMGTDADSDFWDKLKQKVEAGKYVVYDVSGDNLEACSKEAWSQVWRRKERDRIWKNDYEYTLQAKDSTDGKNHCCIYIAVNSTIKYWR